MELPMTQPGAGLTNSVGLTDSTDPALTAPGRTRGLTLLARLRVMTEVGRKMMFHDKLKLLGTLSGVVFATILAVQQLSILFGLLQKNTMFVDNAGADIFIAPPNTELFQPGERLQESVLLRARSTPGVAQAEPLIVTGATLKKPDGGSEPINLVGTSLDGALGRPWNVAAGRGESISEPETMVFEDSEREKYGSLNLGSVREVNGKRVRVGGFTWGLLPFGPAYAFASLDLARELSNFERDRFSYVLVKVKPESDAAAVEAELRRKLPEASVLSKQRFHDSIVSTLLRQQLGLSFGISTSFGLVIGFVIVALSMFSSVLDNLREFGTLKAIGCTNLDLTGLLLAQSALFALIGSFIGCGLVTQVAAGIRNAKLVPIVPLEILGAVPVVMLVLCALASSLALLRIRSLEPGMVFR